MSFDVDATCRFEGRTVAARFATGPGLTALFGPSGAGKSSVLNMVAGLLKPARGRIVVAGEPLFDEATDLPPERRRAGYVFQDARLFPHKRVAANLRYGEKLTAVPERWISFERTIEFLGIEHLLGRLPRSLSGGEAQRVAIGRALLSAPRFLLMDEPLASLDGARREEIMRVIERIRDDLKLPVLYVSHDRSEVERLADHIIEMG